MLEASGLLGAEERKAFLSGRVPPGEPAFDALSETGTGTARDHAATPARDREGFRLDGRQSARQG